MSKEAFVNFLILVVLVAVGAVVVVFFVMPELDKAKDSTTNSASTETASGDSQSQNIPATAATTPIPDVELPRLSEDQLRALLPTDAEFPAAYQGPNATQPLAENISTLADSLGEEYPQAAARFKAMASSYGWADLYGTGYDLCRAGRPVSTLIFEVSQLASTAAGRSLVDDPVLRAFFAGLFFEIDYASIVHGWYITTSSPMTGDCFAEEYMTYIVFEYGGLLHWVIVNTDASLGATQGQAILNEFVPLLISRTNTVAPSPLPATPVPVTPPGITAATTLADLPNIIPSISMFGLEDTYQLNSAVSKTYTRDEFVAAYHAIGLDTLADAINTVGTRHNMIGQEVRYWDTGSACPSLTGLDIEMDLMLFNTADGARGYMNDTELQAAWRATGMITEYIPVGDELLVHGTRSNHHCGAVKITEKIVPYERLLITVSLTSYPEVDDAQLLEIVDAFVTGAIAQMHMLTLQ
ncbi:MAG TPA: hypothetical protein VHP83_08055 [Aggregatilineaceae bacterium]|nr:hypothetical protein [Aggregatilineaceae bacterium]